jgi:hypothetical protein
VAALLDLSHTRPIPFAFPGPYTEARISSRPVEELENAFIHSYRLDRALSQFTITPRSVVQHRFEGEIRWVNYINNRYCMAMTQDHMFYCFIPRDTGGWLDLCWRLEHRPNCWVFDHDSEGVTAIVNTNSSQRSVSWCFSFILEDFTFSS